MNTFLQNYAIVTDGNECPQLFHHWAGLSCLANFAGRRFFHRWGVAGNIYPHMYLLFVGDPGVKKSTAMNIAHGLVKKVGDIEILPSSMTKEAICQWMGKKNSPCLKTLSLIHI